MVGRRSKRACPTLHTFFNRLLAAAHALAAGLNPNSVMPRPKGSNFERNSYFECKESPPQVAGMDRRPVNSYRSGGQCFSIGGPIGSLRSVMTGQLSAISAFNAV